MKRLVSIIVALAAMTALSAQEYLHIDSRWHGAVIPIEEIDSITYGELSHEDKLPALIASDPNLSLFSEALQLTHMADSLLAYVNYDWYIKDDIFIDWNIYIPTLKRSYYKYTAFVETNEVYARYGICTIEDLKDYAAKIYDEAYPEDAGISDPTDRRNSLNRFVSYHLINKYGTTKTLTVADPEVKECYGREVIDIANWYETLMPHSILKCSEPLLTAEVEQIYVNRRGVADHADSRGVFVKGAQITHSASTVNGIYHYIDDIIAYDKETQAVTLNDRIVLNNTTLTPEIMNSGITRVPERDLCYAVLPDIVKMEGMSISEMLRMRYLYSGNNQLDGDEFLLEDVYMGDDFTLNLPAVPAGEYEVCLGVVAPTYCTGKCPAEFYFNGELCGDTVNLTSKIAQDYGWVSDADLGSEQAIAENDSLLYTHRWRKGLPYYYPKKKASGISQRDIGTAGRYVVTRFTSDGKSDNRLTMKFYNEHSISQFHIDYVELCPVSICDNK